MKSVISDPYILIASGKYLEYISITESLYNSFQVGICLSGQEIMKNKSA